jgi:hypothetical protein
MSYRPDLSDFDDVVGPISSTDNALVRFDGTGGKSIQNSTEAFLVDKGGIFIGPNAQSWWGSDNNTGYVAYRKADDANGDYNEIFLISESADGQAEASFDLYGNSSTGLSYYQDYTANNGSTFKRIQSSVGSGTVLQFRGRLEDAITYFNFSPLFYQTGGPGGASGYNILGAQTPAVNENVLLVGTASNVLMTIAGNGSVDITGTTITANDPILNLSQTWNNAGVDFTGIKYDVTDTDSGAGSSFISLQRGGVTRVRVGKHGDIIYGEDSINSNHGTIINAYYDQIATPTAPSYLYAGFALYDGLGSGTLNEISNYITSGEFSVITDPNDMVRIGTGTSKSKILASGQTRTSNTYPILNLSETWNNAGVAFTGLKYNVTDTASAGTSLLQVWQRNSTNILAISKYGTFLSGDYAVSGLNYNVAGIYHQSTDDNGWEMSVAATDSGSGKSGYINACSDPSRSFININYNTGYASLNVYDGYAQLSITGATRVNNSAPIVNLLETWNASGITMTGIKYDVTDTASAAGSLLMDLQVGGSSKFKVNKLGGITVPSGSASSPGISFVGGAGLYDYLSGGLVYVAAGTQNVYMYAAGIVTKSTGRIGFTDGTAIGTQDTFITRDAAATFQLGADAATAITQTFKAHDGLGTDKDGASIIIAGGKSTGTGRGGNFITYTSLTGTTSSSQNSYSTRLYQSAKEVALTESTATTIANVTVASGKYLGIEAICTVSSGDATDGQSRTSRVMIDAVNKSGTVTTAITQVDNNLAESAGASTLTVTYTAVANGNSVDIKANAVSSLTQTYLNCKWEFRINSNDVATTTAT